MSFGRPYILNIDGAIHDGWLLISDIYNKFNKEFLRYYLESDICKHQYSKMAAGGVVSNLNKDIVKSIIVSYPDKTEQNALAYFLRLVDKKINLFNHQIITLKKYKKGIVGSLVRQGIFLDKLSNVVSVEKKTGLPSSYGKLTGKYPFFINNDDGIEKFCDDYKFDGTYIIVNSGGTASIKLFNGKFSAMSDCIVLKPKSNAVGIYYFLKCLEDKMNLVGFQGTGLKHLDQKWFFKQKVIVPNLTEEKIYKIREVFDKKQRILEEKKNKITRLKNYLLLNLFI